jgi:alpha-tubulin suppressor-like RCC1 family protein
LHTQYLLKPLSQLTQTITSVALGQDHTLALTKSGEVFSWGLNRFSQLGYPVDSPTNGRTEEPIQSTPRKVQGNLRKEIIKGVAASKYASACWTEDSVYTWGTNNGQLGEFKLLLPDIELASDVISGYDKAAQPVQVLPRKVSRLTMPVVSIAMTVGFNFLTSH